MTSSADGAGPSTGGAASAGASARGPSARQAGQRVGVGSARGAQRLLDDRAELRRSARCHVHAELPEPRGDIVTVEHRDLVVDDPPEEAPPSVEELHAATAGAHLGHLDERGIADVGGE